MKKSITLIAAFIAFSTIGGMAKTTTGLTVSISPYTNVSCHGASTGSAVADPSGGTSPYTFSWSNGKTTSAITGLSAGFYSVTVTDNASSTATAGVTLTPRLA